MKVLLGSLEFARRESTIELDTSTFEHRANMRKVHVGRSLAPNECKGLPRPEARECED